MDEERFSPAMRSALARVRAYMARGNSLEDAVEEVARVTGFMKHELSHAFALVDKPVQRRKPTQTRAWPFP